ncbi:hypothetical protein [Streptomyces sp. NPDC086835]|uniref:hypothetical protein n=1 Tax=Streptomyces sp. NPDC086835 TaxID=3365761 RepID=UPI0037FA5F91
MSSNMLAEKRASLITDRSNTAIGSAHLLGRHDRPVRLRQITAADQAWIFMLFLPQDGDAQGPAPAYGGRASNHLLGSETVPL